MYHKNIPRDRHGVVRPDLRARALVEWEQLPVEGGYVWRSIGPERGLPQRTGAPARPIAGGLVSDLALGSNPDHIIIGTRSGGVWRSDDNGATWTATGDGLPSLQTVAVGRADPAAGLPIFAAGTGELNNENIRNTGLVGLYRSVDGGRTWSVADGGADATIFRSHDTNQVAVLDAERMIVATRVGLFFSRDGGRNFGNDADHRNGLPMLRGPVTLFVIQGTDVSAVVSGEPTIRPDPVPPDLHWQTAAAAEQPGIYGAQLGAASLGAFTRLHATRDLVADDTVGNSTFDHRADFWLLSAARREIPFDTFAEARVAQLTLPHHSIQFTRDAAGQNAWQTLQSNPVFPLQTHYVHTLALEPLRTGRAAPDAWFGSTALFRQEIRLNSGTFSWSGHERGTDDDTVHVDEHVLHVREQAPGSLRVLVGNDGGLYRTDDAGAHWQTFNEHGSIMFWSLTGARRDATTLRLFGGLQDNENVIGEGPVAPPATGSSTSWTWQQIETGGDGGGLGLIANDSSHWPVENPNRVFLTGSGLMQRATGTNVGDWHLDPVRTDAAPAFFTINPRPFPFSESVAVGRDTAGEWNRIFLASSERRFGPGTLRSGDMSRSANVVTNFTEMISALACAPADATSERGASPGAWDHVWVGLANGEVHFSHDAGATFVPMLVGGPPTPVTGFAIHPRNSQLVAIVYAGFAETDRSSSTQRVFLTTDGTRFRDISGRLGTAGWVPDMPILSVSFCDTDPPALVISSDLGPMITNGPDYGASWMRLGVGLPRMACTSLSVINGRPADPAPPRANGLPPIALGTFGRGVFLLVQPSAAEAVVEFDGGFGAVAVGSTRRRVLRIRNPGGAALTVAAPAPVAPFSYADLPASLDIPARGEKSWTVVCQPTAAGVVSADLTLTLDGSARTVAVSCEAVTGGPPRLAFWPRTVNFGQVAAGSTADATIHIVNTGQTPLHITAAPAGNGPSGAAPSSQLALVSAIPPALEIPAGEERTLTLRFTANTQGSAHEASFVFASDDPVTAPEHFTLTSTGTVGPPAPSTGGGLPTWAWFAIGGAAVLAIAVVVVVATDDDESASG